MLVALAAAVTFGSLMTPIGNLQVLLIALSGGVPNAFGTFFVYLCIPEVVSLYILHRMMIWRLPARAVSQLPDPDSRKSEDPALKRLAKASLGLVFEVIGLRIVLSFTGYELPLVAIAVVVALPRLLLSSRRLEHLRGVERSMQHRAGTGRMRETMMRAGVALVTRRVIHSKLRPRQSLPVLQ